MSEWRDLCRAHQGATETDTAVAVLKALKVPSAAIKVLLPIAWNAVRMTNRSAVHKLELLVAEGAPDDRHASYQEFIRSSFALPDGRRVRWGDATIDDHEQRVAFLSKMRAGIDRTIEMHQAAIDQLRTSGAASLAAMAAAA